MTFLICAAKMHKNPEVVKILIKYKADVSVKDNFVKTALDYVRENKNPEIAELLINHGATQIYLGSQ